MQAVIFALFLTFVVATEGYHRCTTGSDCNDDECCIVGSPIDPWSNICLPLSEKGDECGTVDDSAIGTYRECPCEADLTCEAKEEKDLGNGEEITKKYCV